MESERDKYSMINFEETELRLGLPGGSNDGESSLRNICTTTTATGKRGFSETTAATNVDLKLNLNLCSSSCSSSLNNNNNNDSVSISSVNVDKNKEKNGSASTPTSTPPVTRSNDPAKPPAKAQVVGWPPVRSFRKNIVSGQKSNKEETEKVTVTAATTTTTAVGPSTAATSGSNGGGAYVKVSVEGAPYLRKVDLKQYKSYRELSDALGKMFSATIIDSAVSGPQCQPQHDGKGNGLFTFNGSDYVPTYQDKDGDWMLVGDVPWEMFVESCKRLRIVKGSEAIGLGATPRAAAEEKCQIRS